MCVLGKTQSQLLEKLRMKMRRLNIATIHEEGMSKQRMYAERRGEVKDVPILIGTTSQEKEEL